MVGQAGHRVDALALSYSLEGGGWRGSPFKVRSCHCTQGSHNVTSGEGARSGRKGRGPGSSHGLGRYRANSHRACRGQLTECSVQC